MTGSLRAMSDVSETVATRRRSSRMIALGILLPVVAYYFVVIAFCRNAPYADDYFAILKSTLCAIRSSSAFDVLDALWAQNNEHRVFILRLLGYVEAQVGPISFWSINLFGNLFMLVATYFTVRAQFPRTRPLAIIRSITRHRQVALAVFSISLLCFNFTFFRALAFPTVAVSNIGVYAFAIAAFYYVTRGRYAQSICFLVASALSQANGLAVFPLAVGYLAMERRVRPAIVLAAVGLVVTVTYFIGYNIHASIWSAPMTDLSAEGRSGVPFAYRIGYFLVQLGSIIGVNHAAMHLPLLLLTLPALFGAALLVTHIALTVKGAFKRRPALQLTLVFLAVSLGGMAAFRTNQDLQSWLASRYKLISCLYAAIIASTVIRQIVQWSAGGRRAQLWYAAVLSSFWLCTCVYLIPHISHYRSFTAPLAVEGFSRQQRDVAKRILLDAEKAGLYHW
jgi:hypothetical protein